MFLKVILSFTLVALSSCGVIEKNSSSHGKETETFSLEGKYFYGDSSNSNYEPKEGSVICEGCGNDGELRFEENNEVVIMGSDLDYGFSYSYQLIGNKVEILNEDESHSFTLSDDRTTLTSEFFGIYHLQEEEQ